MNFHFAPAKISEKEMIYEWLKKPHIKEWLHGVGLQNTLEGLEKFFHQKSDTTYWIGYEGKTPFAFLITSPEGEDATTLDLFICNETYLGKGFSVLMIQKFLIDHFSHVKKVLIDPEIANKRAVHVYQKVGFKIIGEFIASWHPVPHYQMELSMTELKKSMNNPSYHLEHYDTIPYEKVVLQGISEEAFHAKGLSPIRPFSVFLKDKGKEVAGGIFGATLYGSLYIDSLWVHPSLRRQGWGLLLMKEAEKIGKARKARFAVVHTMDWEALGFYQKLGYSIEFTRSGYDQESKMFLLRKPL